MVELHKVRDPGEIEADRADEGDDDGADGDARKEERLGPQPQDAEDEGDAEEHDDEIVLDERAELRG